MITIFKKPSSLLFALAVFFITTSAPASTPFSIIKTESPRDTMKTFMQSMQDYRDSLIKGGEPNEESLDTAVKCLDLSEVPAMTKEKEGKEAAVYLKEIIDRVILIDYQMIPNNKTPEAPLIPWRLKGTTIIIAKVESGDRQGEYLFSPATIKKAVINYEKVKNLPYLKGSGKGGGIEFKNKGIPEWAQKKYIFLSLLQWFYILLALLLSFSIKYVIVFVAHIFKKIFQRAGQDWVALLISETSRSLGTCGTLFVLIFFVRNKIELNSMIFMVLFGVLQVLLAITLIRVFYTIAVLFGEYLKKLGKKEDAPINPQIASLISRFVQVLVVIVGVLLTAQNLGIEVSSILAGLGIGGLAVALATKDSLSNFFASIMIMIDHPFREGHWIVSGGHEGSVEKIGFRSTRIRTFYNSVVSIPNSQLSMTGIDNMGLRQYRRVRTTLGVTYDTKPELLEKFIKGVRETISSETLIKKDNLHVVFNNFGPSSLDILLYFFIETKSYEEELATRQRIFLGIIRLAESLKVNFAFPTQTLHVESLPPSN